MDDSTKKAGGESPRDRLDTLKDEMVEDLGSADGNKVDPQSETHIETLLRIADRTELFIAVPGAEPFATFDDFVIDGSRQLDFKSTAPVNSTIFRRSLMAAFAEERDQPPSRDAMTRVIELLAAWAGKKKEIRVYNRVGEDAQTRHHYIDLGTRDRRVVEVRRDGWSVVETCPLKFKRHKNMGALPIPRRGGSLDQLKQLLNLPDDDDRSFVLVIAYLLVALRSMPNYLVLIILGEHGSAKTTFAKVLRSLIDPVVTAPLRNAPESPREVAAALASGTHVIGYNNVSYVQPWLSDLLCVLACGDGVGWRKYYTDDDERLFDGAHPIVLNGIEEFATRPDLLDRSIVLELEKIPEAQRKTDEEMARDVDRLAPEIFGALLDAMAVGLRELPTTRLETLPRMADAAKWVVACEKSGLWNGPSFLSTFMNAQEEASDVVFQASPVAAAFMKWAIESLRGEEQQGRDFYRTTPAQALDELSQVVGEDEVRSRSWPRTARALSGHLTRLAPELRRRGIEFDRPRANGVRYFEIRRARKAESAGDRAPGKTGTGE